MPQAARKSRQSIRTQVPANGGFSVNEGLTPKRPIEAGQYGSMVVRVVRALGRRGQDGDLQALVELVKVRRELDLVTQETVRRLRLDHDYTWTDISRMAGVSKQAAQQRWGRP